MYAINSYNGSDLPHKTLCITFDDGPGEHTYAIGKFLHEQGVNATFFVVGKYACEHPDILQSLKTFGHLIGNHTYEHPDMPYYRSVNGNVQGQIMRTDALIERFAENNIIYYRSPYGKWSAELAHDLNANILTALNHIGPVHWDMGGIDCYYWQLDKTVNDAVEEYYREISAKSKGIVLFHDDIADMDYVKPRNKTLELLKALIPKLKSENYNFVRLDEIRSIKEASEKKLLFYLLTGTKKCISLKTVTGKEIICSSKKDKLSEFSIQMFHHKKVALQSSNGLFLSATDGEVNADKNEIENSCLFDLIPVTDNQIMFRTITGNYLTVDKKNDNRLTAKAPYMRNGERFFFYPTNTPAKMSVPLKTKIELFKKRFLYIKSKVMGA